MTEKLTYKDAGVDTKEGERAVKLMKDHVKKTFNENWFKAAGYRKATIDASGNMIPGESVSKFTPYNPLELE